MSFNELKVVFGWSSVQPPELCVFPCGSGAAWRWLPQAVVSFGLLAAEFGAQQVTVSSAFSLHDEFTCYSAKVEPRSVLSC